MLTSFTRLGSCRCTAALALWAVVFVLLSAVLSPSASALIEAGRGAGAEFDVLDSRTRHGISVLVDVDTDSAEDVLDIRHSDRSSAARPHRRDDAAAPPETAVTPSTAAASHSPPGT